MQVVAFRSPIVRPLDDIFAILQQTLPDQLSERCVVVVTSKIVALAEGRVEPVEGSGAERKYELVRQEAEYYLDPNASQYGVMLTVKNGLLAVNAGIDESNTGGYYVLWPKDCQASANEIWSWLRKTYTLKEVGVIVCDSKTSPLFWGVTGASVAHAGFSALNDKRHTSDIFGRELQMTQVNVAQALAGAAVFEMGETNEQTPVAVITDIKEISFQDHVPTESELQALKIELEDDVFAPVLMNATWKKGGAGQS